MVKIVNNNPSGNSKYTAPKLAGVLKYVGSSKLMSEKLLTFPKITSILKLGNWSEIWLQEEQVIVNKKSLLLNHTCR